VIFAILMANADGHPVKATGHAQMSFPKRRKHQRIGHKVIPMPLVSLSLSIYIYIFKTLTMFF
jgi:hypothetical protein